MRGPSYRGFYTKNNIYRTLSEGDVIHSNIFMSSSTSPSTADSFSREYYSDEESDSDVDIENEEDFSFDENIFGED